MKNIILSFVFIMSAYLCGYSQNYNLSFSNVSVTNTQTCFDINLSLSAPGSIGAFNLVFTFDQSNFTGFDDTGAAFNSEVGASNGYSAPSVTSPSAGQVSVNGPWFFGSGFAIGAGSTGCGSSEEVTIISNLCLTHDAGYTGGMTATGGTWFNLDGTGTATVVSDTGTPATFLTANSGTNTMSGADCIENLPVELATFDASPVGTAIALNWKSATEVNFDGYQLERSLDAVNFDKIAWITGAGNSIEEQEYRYIDNDVKSNIVYYYRLKMVDLDETFDYSNIRSASISGKEGSVEVFPNPTKTSVNLAVDVADDDRVLVRIYDTTGKVVLERVQDLNEGNNLLAYDISNLSSGLYRILVSGESIRATKNVVVAK